MPTCSGCGSVWTSTEARWCGRCGASLGDRAPGPDSSDRAPFDEDGDATDPEGEPEPATPPTEVDEREQPRGRGWAVAAVVAVVGVVAVVQQTVMPEVGSSSEEVHATEADDNGERDAEQTAAPDEEPAPEREPPGDPEPAAARLCEPRPFEVVDDPPDGWEQLPPPPVNREEAELLWVDGQLLQIGGSIAEQNPDAHGEVFAYTPTGPQVRARWECLGDGPFRLEEVAAVATEGSEVYVVSRGRAAVFLPDAEQWHDLPEAPFSHTPFTLAWTGEELIAWGNRQGTATSGAIYDPDTLQWRPMAEAPLPGERGDAVWTGDQLVVVAQGGAAAYDPADDVWTELPPSGLAPQAVAATATADVVVTYDYMLGAGYYDLTDQTWHEQPPVPIDSMECFPEAVTLGDGTGVAAYCGQIVLLDPTSWSWQVLDVPEDDGGTPLLWSSHPIVIDGALHLITSGSFGQGDQHWRYRP